MTRTYSNEPQGVSTPTVTNSYDGVGISPAPGFAKGKLTKVTSSVSESRYTDFDAAGRLMQFQQITDGQTYTSSYEYNLSGALIKETYPSGRVVENEFDASGDLAKIFGKATPASVERTYANNFTYSPDGKIERLRLGSGVWESAKFNSRLQVTELSVGWGPTSSSIWKMATEYGELQADGTVDLTTNSGNIGKQTVSFGGLAQPFVQSFSYDALQRLTEAKETNNGSQTWREVFDYDRYGNRTTHNKFIGTNEVPQTDETRPEIDAAKNRFKPTEGYTFDANGNIVVDFNGRQFTFNGDNKQTQVKDSQNNVIGTYYFDGEGKRVKKVVGAETTIFVYSGGKLIAEYSTETRPTNPTTRFTVTDQLGSPRVILDSAGDVISRRDFLPFGEEIAPDTTYRTDALKYGREDEVRQKFTGYQSDEETGLDFAEARMYENRHGRFTAVDPLFASGNSADPQTFNRYVYVMNNPLVLTDPQGLQAGKPVQPDQGRKPETKIIENPKAAKSGNTHISSVKDSPYAYNNEQIIKMLDGSKLTADGKDAHYGFGTVVDYKINFAEGVRAKDISVTEVVKGEITDDAGNKKPYNFTKTIDANSNGEFKDDIGTFSDVPIPGGTKVSVTQTLSVTATYIQDDGTPIKTTEVFRTNKIVTLTGDQKGNRSITVEDISKYEENTIQTDEIKDPRRRPLY